jgi:hypothetical protein
MRTIATDNRNYFASTLTSYGPSKALNPKDNLYIIMNGEWDVAYIRNPGTSEEQAIPGEWTFAWINDGQAIQDVLTVPYRWQSPPSGFKPVVATTVRIFNSSRTQWEGFHVINNQMIFFGVVKTDQNQIMEHFNVPDGPLTVWLYHDLEKDSFKVTVSESADGGLTYRKTAEVWAKRRDTTLR